MKKTHLFLFGLLAFLLATGLISCGGNSPKALAKQTYDISKKALEASFDPSKAAKPVIKAAGANMDQNIDPIIDNAGLLSAKEKANLGTRIKKIAAKYNFNLIILTEKSIGGEDPIDYSWNFLDSHNLYGETWDGCLLLVSTEDRDYAFTASGRGDKILTNDLYDKMENDVVSYLKKNNYAGAFEAFIRTWEKLLAR